jgi:WD40 repeat protein
LPQHRAFSFLCLSPFWESVEAVKTLAFSPDGKKIAAGSADGAARLWDVETGQDIKQFTPLRSIEGICFSPNGRIILAGGAKAACLCDAITGQVIRRLDHPDNVLAVAISSNGLSALTGCADGRVRLWDLSDETGKPCRLLPDPKESADWQARRAAALLGIAPNYVELIPLLFQQLKPTGAIRSVAFSPDSRTILAGGDDGLAWRWDTATGQAVDLPLLHQGVVRAVAYSPDGRRFVTGGDDSSGQGAVRLWDAATGKPRGAVIPCPSSVRALHFHPDGRRFLTLMVRGEGMADEDGAIQLRDTVTGSPIGNPFVFPGPVRSACFSSSGQEICIGGGLSEKVKEMLSQNPLSNLSWTKSGFALLIDAQPPSQPFVDLKVNAEVSALAWRPDGQALLSAGVVSGGWSEIRLWDATTGHPLGRPFRHRGSVNALAFSPDGEMAVVASTLPSGRGEARLWDPVLGQALATPLPHPSSVLAAAFSPDGKTILTGCADGCARFWDTTSGRANDKPLRHPYPLRAIVFSPNGKLVLTSATISSGIKDANLTYQGEARLWDVVSRTQLGDAVERGLITAIAFSPDGRQVAIASEHSATQPPTVLLWNVAGEERPRTFKTQGHLLALAFRSDGQTIRGVFRTGVCIVWGITKDSWELSGPRQHGAFFGQGHAASIAAFSPDDRSLATDSGNLTVRVLQGPLFAKDSLERINLVHQLMSGYELAEDGKLRALNGFQLRERRRRLKELDRQIAKGIGEHAR